MKLPPCPVYLAVLIVATPCGLRAAANANGGAANSGRPGNIVSLREILWRGIQGPADKYEGTVSDVLLQLPAGDIVGLAIESEDSAFDRPRVVPASAAQITSRGPLRVSLSLAQWLHEPVVDWGGGDLVGLYSPGDAIRGFYEQGWAKLDGGGARPVKMLVYAGTVPSAVPFASALHLVNTPALDINGQQIGVLGGFLFDWDRHRAIYALVGSQPAAAELGISSGYAVPIGMLEPADKRNAVVVTSPPEAFTQAPALPPYGAGANPMQIYRYGR